jgi:acyl-CoA synthetase (AMP-forming)/AMP-acid ligase II
MLLQETLRHSRTVWPQRLAVIDDSRSLTYADTEDRALRLANALREGLGMRRGERFAFLSINRAEFVEVYFAAAIAGVVCVPINFRLAGPEIAEILKDAEVRVLLAEESLSEHLAAVRSAGFDGRVVTLGARGCDEGEYSELLRTARGTVRDEPIADSDVVMQMYTSGTTGQPKGVMLSHRNLTSNSWHLIAEGSANSQDRYLTSAPLSHLGAGSRVFLLAHVGCTHIVHAQFDPDRVVGAMLKGDANAALIVPAMVRQLLDTKEARGASLRGHVRQLTYGTAPMPRALLTEALERFGCDFQQGYGLTEASPNLTLLPPADHVPDAAGEYSERLGSVGRETIGVRVRVVDEHDADVRPGAVGEVIAAGENVMEGYWNRPEETSSTLRGGWLRTGDLATLSSDGYVFLVERKKDMLVSGGFNVYPREVERQLEKHPAVVEVGVIGASHERWGEVPVAFVVAKGDTGDHTRLTVSLEEFCSERLARFKVPRRYVFLDALPRNAVGKVAKHDLHELLDASPDPAR